MRAAGGGPYVASEGLQGILAALVTPMDEGGRVDEARLAALVKRVVSGGVSGVVPCGSTGEFPYMTAAERRRATEVTIEATDGKAAVVPHTGALTTADTVELSKHAQECGAAAVMIVAPFYEPLKWPELVAHYAAVRDAIDIPIVYYHLPSVTGLKLAPAELARLCSEAGIDYLKDTGGDAVATADLIRVHADTMTTFVGFDSLTYFGFAYGAVGSIWGAASFMPELCVALHRAVRIDRDLETADALWSAIWPICRYLEDHDYTAAVKAACRLSGIEVGPPRRPLLDPPRDSVGLLEMLLKRAADALSAHQRSSDRTAIV
jgi:dihydrodipicolinate synthase/N-acetylneuraminate lyase